MAKERRAPARKPANEIGAGQSALTRTQALIAAAILLTAIVGLAYLAVMLMKPGAQPPLNATPFPTATPRPANYSLSPLIAEYGIDQTPSLVINCYRRADGTFAFKEESGEVPAGTERNALLSSLCSATGKQIFCSQVQSGAPAAVTALSHAACSGEDGRALIYAFHSPSCPYCRAQWPALQMLAAEMPEFIELKRICSPSTLAEDPLCEASIRAGLFSE